MPDILIGGDGDGVNRTISGLLSLKWLKKVAKRKEAVAKD